MCFNVLYEYLGLGFDKSKTPWEIGIRAYLHFFSLICLPAGLQGVVPGLHFRTSTAVAILMCLVGTAYKSDFLCFSQCRLHHPSKQVKHWWRWGSAALHRGSCTDRRLSRNVKFMQAVSKNKLFNNFFSSNENMNVNIRRKYKFYIQICQNY